MKRASFLVTTIALLLVLTGCPKVVNYAPKLILTEFSKCLGGSSDDYAASMQQTSDSGYIVAGYTRSTDGDVTGNHGDYDFWIVKLTEDGTITWQKCLGSSAVDCAYSVQQTSDNGYIVAGSTRSTDGDVTGNHGNYDFWIVKLTEDGIIDWQKCLGGSAVDCAYSVQQTSDNGYIVAGSTHSTDGDVTGNHGDGDCWMVKLTEDGTIAWQKSLGGTGYDYAASVRQTSDGGYIVAGYTESTDGDVTGNHGSNDYWIVKLDNTGNITWQKSLGGSAEDFARSVEQTSDGGYIVAGSTHSTDGDVTENHGSNDCWIVKLDNTGNIDWQKCLGGTGYDWASSMQQTSDGGYVVAGYTVSTDGDVTENHGNSDYWIVKLDNARNIDWQKSLGGTSYDYADSVWLASNGGYVVAGRTQSTDGDVTGNHGNTDYWIVKLKEDF